MAEMLGLSRPVPITISTRPAKNGTLPPNAERPMERCPSEISSAPMKMERRRPSQRSAIQPPGRLIRYTKAP